MMRRVVAMLLCIIMVVGLLPLSTLAAETTPSAQASGETTYVLAGSDFQPTDRSTTTGVNLLNQILNPIYEAGYTSFDGFLFAGDYDYGYTNSTAGKNALQSAVKEMYPDISHEVYVEGNHDCASRQGVDLVANGTLSPSGANDADAYGVYVIHERDYMWASNGINPTTIQQTADKLEVYLNAKRNAGYTKPIFVISHLPLHYCMRTRQDGDGMYANYIFDVLNEAGNAGLNIIFMFGHNHSHGWDDYLGGAAIYLAKGDKINIAQASQTTFQEETLAFTYMNAGYVSYYGTSYTSDVDKTLTMSVFEITDDSVTVKRFDSEGVHDLKSTGVYNVEYPDSSYYATNATVYTSPQTIALNKTITPAGEEVEAPDSGSTSNERTYTRVTSVSQLVSGGQYLIIENGSTDYFMLPESISNSAGDRVGYNIEATSVAGGDTITGDYSAKEWTMTGSGTSWVLSTDAGSAYMAYQSSSRAYGRISTTNSSTFTIGGSADAFSFTTTTNNTTYVFDHSSAGMINGYVKTASTLFYIYRLTNEGSDAPTVDTTGGNWVTITEPTTGDIKYVLDTDGINTNTKYLIVNTSSNGTAYVLTNNNGSVTRTQVTISNGEILVSDDTNINWIFSGTDSGTVGNQGRYIYLDRYTNLSLTASGTATTFSHQGNGAYQIYRYSDSRYNYLRYSNSSWGKNSNRNSSSVTSVYLFAYNGTTESTPGLYGKIEGELTYNVDIGTSKEAAVQAVKDGITIKYHQGDESAANTLTAEEENTLITWTLDPSYDGVTPGEYSVTIAYNGVTLGVAKVVVPSAAVKGYTVEPAEGTVGKGAAQTAKTGALIYVQLEDDKYYTVPVTVNMLTKADGSSVSTGEMGTIENLTLTYNGVVITKNFTLHVTAKGGNNYPEYPNEGAVQVDKTATGIDFQASGIAQIELSASGVPVKKGADVIVMLDTSSSMNTNKVTVNGVEMTRLDVLKASLQAMMTQLQANGTDGQPMDIRIAVADFNRYYPDASSPYYIDSADHMTGGSIRTNADGTNLVYTGSGKLDADAFVSVHSLTTTAFNGLTYKSGTNYDYAFDAVYQLGEAIVAQNAASGEERDLFVIFMSDGAPFQYNYFSEQSDGTGSEYWNNWLQGTMTDAMFANGSNKTYYNADGKHWMAEAIKGDPANTYPVIRKNNAADTDGDDWVDVNGLGATMYSIGFCLADDKLISVDSMDMVIRGIASNENYYFRADSADDLDNAFTQIGRDIAYAANNARFVDQMGDNFSLQMKPSTYTLLDGTKKTLNPIIEIISYDIWTRDDYEKGDCTLDMIGDRKGSYTILETVTFSEDGTQAFSDQIGGGTVNILADGTKEGYVKGVIYAKYFIYNTNVTEVAVEGVSIPTGKTADGITSGSTNLLPSETFYWKMGTVQTSELAMRYYVYLDGSMEGTKPAGSYATNEFAVLYYDNYLGNSCLKETVSPTVAWKAANVSYAFYLVNEKGEIIVNQTTGETGSFANKVAITNPVVYTEILLNNIENVAALEVAALGEGVLPTYYQIYDAAAQYTVNIRSNGSGSWQIVQGTDKVASTYVTQYMIGDASAYSNELAVDDTGNDYTHTVVWFAVVWQVEAHPDTVVVDFGLPMDITVLSNDMFGENGKLAGIGAYSSNLNLDGYDITLAAGFGNTYKGEYGSATINTETGLVRYQLDNMSIDGYDQFAYAVHYTGSENAGYYYDTITVIPATNIYYEDSFVTYENLIWQPKEGGKAWEGEWVVDEDANGSLWSQVGTTKDGVQDEDRPGKYSLKDANNIYGYDSVNKGMATYSMGSAMKATVDLDNAAQASFTFYGTGFDVISMTNNTTGTILVDVTDADGNIVHQLFVDTFYGYKQEAGDADGDGVVAEGEMIWVVDPDATGSIYQVPVMKVEGLPYGQYNVTIRAQWDMIFDHVEGSESYDFYLDAIRIYDPANNGAADGSEDTTIEDVYVLDGEGWPSYFELRNKLIDNATLGNASTTTKVEGLVFIDGDASIGDAQLEDYKNFGPNNEVYLAPGQRVAFILNKADNVANVHIGLKSADGKTASYTITNIALSDSADGKVKAGQYYNQRTYTVNTGTEMYYDLTEWVNGDIIVISNYTESTQTTGILSITNVKTTYQQNPNGVAAASEEPVMFMTAPAAALTLRTLNTMYLPETFEPEALDIATNKSAVKVGDKVKVTVTTSSEVAYITINGQVITEYRTNRRTGERIWTILVQAEEAGEMNVEVVAYNAENLASDAFTTSITVQEKKDPMTLVKELLKSLFGGLFG